MIDLQDKNYCPAVQEIGEYINNSVFTQFCAEIRKAYKCNEKIEYSSCSWERGWNIKFKKAGRTLCTVYPREGYFTIMIVIGTKEKEPVEAILPECTARLSDIYNQTQEGNGQRWLKFFMKLLKFCLTEKARCFILINRKRHSVFMR